MGYHFYHMWPADIVIMIQIANVTVTMSATLQGVYNVCTPPRKYET